MKRQRYRVSIKSMRAKDRNIMKLINLMITLIFVVTCCGVIEDSQDIPEPGTYRSISEGEGYQSTLVISKKEKGYAITLSEYSEIEKKNTCVIEATGKKSSYGIWVEIPAYGPRLPIIIRKRNEYLEISLKGPDDPKSTFTYCVSDRTPAGRYQIIKN